MTDLFEPDVELRWRGKETKVKTVSLPFQTVEYIDLWSAQASTERQLAFEQMRQDDPRWEGWTNRLIWGDNKNIMASLLDEFEGQIDLIYIDPPFATGATFKARVEVGEAGDKAEKAESIIEQKAYNDTWGRGKASYLQMMYDRLALMYRLLSPTGTIYVHLAHHVGQYVKVMLDEIFGEKCFQNEIIWFYKTGGASKGRFARKHDNIFFYSKSPDGWVFVPQKERSYMMHKYGFKKSDFQIDETTGLQYSMVYTRDVWEIPSVGSATFERVGFDTQKPEALLERIVRASSNPGDLVADFFCGSGTTLVVAEHLFQTLLHRAFRGESVALS